MKADQKKRFRRGLIWFLVLLAVVIALAAAMTSPGPAIILYYGTGGLIIPILWFLIAALIVMALRLTTLAFPRAGRAITAVAAIIAAGYFAAPVLKTKILAARYVAQLEQVEPISIDPASISGIEMNQIESPPMPYVKNTPDLIDDNCNINCFDLLRFGGADWVRLIRPVGYHPVGLDETPNRMVFSWVEAAECRKFHPSYPTGEGCLVVRRDTGAQADLAVSQRAEKANSRSSANNSGTSFGQTHLRVTEAHDASGALLFRRQQIIYGAKTARISPEIDVASDLSSLGFPMSDRSGYSWSWPWSAPDDALERAGFLVLVRSMLDAHEGPFGVGEENQFERWIIANWTSFLTHDGIESELENATLCRILAEPTASKASRISDPEQLSGRRTCPTED